MRLLYLSQNPRIRAIRRPSRSQCRASLAIILTIIASGIAHSQTPAASPATTTSPAVAADLTTIPVPVVQDGYVIHQSVDLGGHLVQVSGSSAMYDTLVNLQSGPRILGQTYEMHAVPGSRHALADTLGAFSSGLGGDPNNLARLNFSKGKLYEFTGLFRRDRQYFDYDLLSNPLVPANVTSPIGTATSTELYTFPQVNYSPVLYNSVRRMTDTDVTVLPLSRVTIRGGYSQNIFAGPSYSGVHMSPLDALLVQNLRNSDDDFRGAIDWKPLPETVLTFEEVVTHYKEDTSFALAPISTNLQLSNGTPVSFGFDNLTPPACTNGGQPILLAGGSGPAPTPSGGLGVAAPTANPTCAGFISYTRSAPTRAIFPTEVVHFQSSSIHNVPFNGDVRYTAANSNLPEFNEYFNGIDRATRFEQFTGHSHTKRIDVGADLGVLWQATETVRFAEQFDYSDFRQPGYASLATQTWVTATGPAAESMLNNSVTTTGVGKPTIGRTYLGQRVGTNNVSATWDVSARASLSLTYRYRSRKISNTNMAGTINATTGVVFTSVHENGGVLNFTLRPTSQWQLNGSVEAIFADNAYTPVSPRETQHYRLHTTYKPRPWATVSGVFNDLERRNNQNSGVIVNNPLLAGAGTTFNGGSLALNHVDHSRGGSVAVSLAPTEHYGLDFSYAYTDIYTSTNICYNTGQTSSLYGGPASFPAVVTNTPCPINIGEGNNLPASNINPDDAIKDFMDAPSQFASAAVALSPHKLLHSSIGYRLSSVNGSQTFLNPRNVNGSLDSTYQTPFVNVAFTVRPRWIWKADYAFYGYGEGGPSGPSLCQEAAGASFTACALNAPSGPTAPRNFHGNLITLGMHYDF